MSKADMLFLERHCSKCGPVKAVLDLQAVEADDYRGRDGQELLVVSSQSPAASVVLLNAFGLSELEMPVLLKGDGEKVNSPKRIIEYLEKQGMAS